MNRFIATLALLIMTGAAQGQLMLTEGTNFSVHSARDGRLAIDLLGKIWILPSTGGAGEEIASGSLPARRPRWSPTASAITYQATAANQEQLWLFDFATGEARNISDGQFFDQHPSWHPGGERIVYSSDRKNSGFDLWEIDLETGLNWRITHRDGDETEPTWSADGRDLVYIQHVGTQWSVMLRRHGQVDRVLESSQSRLSAPEWRPDGSLITFLRHGEGQLSVEMVILSDPPLIRTMIAGEDLFIAPVTWLDRQHLLYTANGVIRKRNFNSWSSSTVPFRVPVSRRKTQRAAKPAGRNLPSIDAPGSELVIRVARLFDGIGGGYKQQQDILINGGRIEAIEAQRERPGKIVVDMADLTALPGFVDSYASIPLQADATLGPLMLSFGVTTIVADHANAKLLNARWSGKDMPGPRVLGEDWQPDLDTARSMLQGVNSMPASPMGIRYRDQQFSGGSDGATFLSGLADARTSGLRALLGSRQAALLQRYPAGLRRFIEKPQLSNAAASVVLGSKANGLAPGIAQHAEFHALADAGMTQEQILRAAGVNAAAALGLGLQLGRIAPGSVADIVLVDGDPLSNIQDAQKVVGVVRNGRFFSAIGLIERAQTTENVE